MATTDRYIIGVDQISVEKHPDCRCSASHVDHGHPEGDLVLDQTREPGCIRADDQSIQFKVRTPDRRTMIADGSCAGGDEVHVDPKSFTDHSARITDAPAIVNREPNRHRMDYVAVTRFAQQVALLEDAMHLRIRDLAGANADLGLDNARCEEAT